MSKNYEILLKNITFYEDVSEYIFSGIENELEKFFLVLNEKEKEFVEYRYGLNDNKFKTIDEVVEAFNVKKEKLINIEKVAFRKLRLLFGLNNNSFKFNAKTIMDNANGMLEIQQFYDSYHASERGEKESSTTKFYKRVINVAESFKKNKGLKKVLK